MLISVKDDYKEAWFAVHSITSVCSRKTNTGYGMGYILEVTLGADEWEFDYVTEERVKLELDRVLKAMGDLSC